MRRKRIPSYRLNKTRGYAVVTIEGRDIYLGRYGTPESREKYERVIGEWLSNGVVPCTPRACKGLTVSELMVRYLDHCDGYYVKHGRPTGETRNIEEALGPVRDLYSSTAAKDFGPLALKAVRDKMIEKGWARTTVNGRVNRVRRMFKWAVENELVPASVFEGLRAVSGLRHGRSSAPDPKPVEPVPLEVIEMTKAKLLPLVAAMVEVQLRTGMRPGEVVIMRTGDIDMSGDVWIYRPRTHKTEHFGRSREVGLGPKSQEALRPFLKADPYAPVFSPREAMEMRAKGLREARKTPVQPSQRNRRKKRPQRRPSEQYTTVTYARAIARACDLAFPVPDRLEEDEEANVWKREHRWTPNQLRHTAATLIRREHGIEAARAILGHSTAVTTELYAEIDRMSVMSIMREIG